MRRPDLQRLIAITIAEYERVRGDPRHFAVFREHVVPDVERVVDETERFVVVEKREGLPAEIAEEEDPRDLSRTRRASPGSRTSS